MITPRQHGTISYVSPRKNYAFIQGDDGEEYFFYPKHIDTFTRVGWADLQVGYRVQFIAADNPSKKEKAVALEVQVTDATTLDGR